MGELQSRPTAKEDRMFELLKSANLAYDRKNELFAACSTAKKLETVDEGHYAFRGRFASTSL